MSQRHADPVAPAPVPAARASRRETATRRLGLALAHFLVAGAAAVVLLQILNIQSFWAVLGILTALMLLVTVFEYLIERKVLDAPEKSAMAITGLAGLLDFFFLPERREFMWKLIGVIIVEFIEYLVQRSRGSGRGGDFY